MFSCIFSLFRFIGWRSDTSCLFSPSATAPSMRGSQGCTCCASHYLFILINFATLCQLGYATMGEKTIFRISKVPQSLDVELLAQAIARCFSLERDAFKIHSLASDAPEEAGRRCRVATVSFRERPARLRSPQRECIIDVPISEEGAVKNCRLYFDSDFLGFTPLSTFEKDDEQTIEYGNPHLKDAL